MQSRFKGFWLIKAAMAFCAAGIMGAAAAQDWPTRAVTVVVPYPPGGNTDVITRVVMDKLSGRLGQPIIVENKPGAGSIIGSNLVAKAAPDGYTLLIAIPGFALNQAQKKDLPYGPNDLMPVSLLTRTSLVVVSSSHLPARNFQELLAYGRKASPPLTFASSGTTSLAYLLSERFLQSTGIEQAMHVPYKGSADALIDLVGGRIGFMFDAVSAMGPHIEQGTVQAVAVTGENRSPMLPDVPTIRELGYPDLVSYAWAGLLAPAGTPDSVAERLSRELAVVLKDPDVIAKLEKLNTEPVGSTPAEFAQFLAKEVAMGKEIFDRNEQKQP